jgi:branched-chain amino acid transport system substrate-binding protein
MLWLAAVGCSFSTFEYTPCEVSAECREAFGFGSTCGGDGYCRALDVPERCAKTWPPDLLVNTKDYADWIVLGSVTDRGSSRLEEQAAELAFIGVDYQGGLDGTQFGLVECDSTVDGTATYDNDDEITVVTDLGTWLAEEVGVPGIVGSSTSPTTQALYEATRDAEVLLVSPSATSPALTLIDGFEPSDEQPGLMWRTVPSDEGQARAVAYDMNERRVARVQVIAVEGAYGEGLANAFIDAFSGEGHEVTLLTFDPNDPLQLGEHISATANGDFEEVLFIGASSTSVADFLNGAATFEAFSRGDVRIFLTDAARYGQLFEETSGAEALYRFIRGTSPALASGPVYESFRGAYASEFGGDSADDAIYTPYAFDAAWLLIYGTAWSKYQEGSITGIGMAKGLRHVSEGDPVQIQSTNWTTVKANFEAGQGVDLEGASGKMDFDPLTEETKSPVDIWTIGDADGWVFVNDAQFAEN